MSAKLDPSVRLGTHSSHALDLVNFMTQVELQISTQRFRMYNGQCHSRRQFRSLLVLALRIQSLQQLLLE